MDCSDIEIELDPSADERLAPPSIPTLLLPGVPSLNQHVGPNLLKRFIDESAHLCISPADVDDHFITILANLRGLRDILIFARADVEQPFVVGCLQVLLQHCAAIKASPSLGFIEHQRDRFLAEAHQIVKQMIEVEEEAQIYDQSLRRLLQSIQKAQTIKTRPTFEAALQPWYQFLRNGAPGLPPASKSFMWPAPVKSLQVVPFSALKVRLEWTDRFLSVAHRVAQVAADAGNTGLFQAQFLSPFVPTTIASDGWRRTAIIRDLAPSPYAQQIFAPRVEVGSMERLSDLASDIARLRRRPVHYLGSSFTTVYLVSGGWNNVA